MKSDQKKKILQYAGTAIIALLAFILIIMPEKNSFDHKNDIKNPFLVEKTNQIIETSKAEKEKEIFTDQGELFLLSEETKLDLREEKRELLSGSIFWSTSLLIKEKIPDQSTNFSMVHFKPHEGEIKGGSLAIKQNGGSVFLKKDDKSKTIEIYALDHPVSIFFEGVGDPFIVPPGMKIKINENMITEKTPNIFYSKLKRDFEMERFEENKGSGIPTDENAEEIIKGREILKNEEAKISKFVEATHENWIFEKENILSMSIKKIQSEFGIGIPQRMKDALLFEETITPFMESYFDLKGKDPSAVSSVLNVFENKIQGNEWQNLLAENPELKIPWEQFFNAHKIWIKNKSDDDPEKSYEIFWMPKNETEKIEQTFATAENFIAQKQNDKARETLQKIQEMLKKEEDQNTTGFNDPAVITKLRRLLTEILKNEESLQTEEIFDLYRMLVKKEIKIYETKESHYRDEIHLECGQDILEFLRYFLEDELKNNISQILITTYKTLDISGIQQRMGTNIFNEDDRKIIDILFLIGNSGATKDELFQLKAENEKEKIISDQFSLSNNDSNQNTTASNTASSENKNLEHIQNAKGLKNFLEKNGLDTTNIVLKTVIAQDQGLASHFSGVTLEKTEISGNFYYDAQIFDTLFLEDRTWNSIKPEFFIKVITQGIKDKKEELLAKENEKQMPSEGNNISQNSPIAIIKRKGVEELFQKRGLILTKSNIEIRENSMETFSVTDAILQQNGIILNFTFNDQTKVITKVMASLGEKKKDFGSQVFALDIFPENILTQLKVK